MTSCWGLWRLKSLTTRMCVQQQVWATSKNTSKLRITNILWRNLNTHKVPVMRKAFPGHIANTETTMTGEHRHGHHQKQLSISHKIIFTLILLNIQWSYRFKRAYVATWTIIQLGHTYHILWVCTWPVLPLVARFMRPTWGPSGADRTEMGPMLAPWTLLSGAFCLESRHCDYISNGYFADTGTIMT